MATITEGIAVIDNEITTNRASTKTTIKTRTITVGVAVEVDVVAVVVVEVAGAAVAVVVEDEAEAEITLDSSTMTKMAITTIIRQITVIIDVTNVIMINRIKIMVTKVCEYTLIHIMTIKNILFKRQ